MAAMSASIRMYRLHELGDCFLVTFANGSKSTRVLIDCGSFRNTGASPKRLQAIVDDIVKTLDGKPLDVVVGTHQHNDHLSGFVHCEKSFRDDLQVGQVWLSWLDNPQDKAAQAIGEKHNNLVQTLYLTRTLLAGRSGLRAIERLGDVLGFYGANGKTPPALPADAVKVLKSLGQEKPAYLKPGRSLELPGLPDDVRVHVLGPPRDNTNLYRKDPRKGETYDLALASYGLAATRFLEAVQQRSSDASRNERQYPFRENCKYGHQRKGSGRLQAIKALYDRRDDAWRKIDDAWLEQAEALALFLDTYTNNSSLVLAFEMVKSKKVLLFAADAQSGNWSSWSTVKWEQAGVSTDDLLSRTVFYKVGHHASHNATLVDAFEKMNHPDLVALIPVHKKDPNIVKANGWKMPAKNLFKKLRERTSNRVLQMDGVNPASCDFKKDPAKSAWKAVGIKPVQTDLYIELTVS